MIERRIVIGLITSTEYLSQVKDFWDLALLESDVAKRLAMWCWEYYDEFAKAPGRDIEPIFYEKTKVANFPKDIAKEIEEDILPGLSNEYEQEGLNIDSLVKDTKKYFTERHLSIHKDRIDLLIQKGKLNEAEKLALEFSPLPISAHSLEDFIQTIHQIRATKRAAPRTLLKPWLKEGQVTIIYGNYGSGKSLLTILISYILGLKNFDSEDAEIGTWQVKNPTGTLYIDGELGEIEMEERIRQFEWLGEQEKKYRIRIFSIPEYQMATEDSFYLGERKNQLKIIKWLKAHPNYRLIVLDSVSTLFGLKEENDNSEWNEKIHPFLRDLRAINVACLLLHHSGKDGKKGLRGASSMGAMAHMIFRIVNHTEKDTDQGEAWFTILKDKQRARGFSFKAFGLHFMQFEDDTETHWKVTGLD